MGGEQTKCTDVIADVFSYGLQRINSGSNNLITQSLHWVGHRESDQNCATLSQAAEKQTDSGRLTVRDLGGTFALHMLCTVTCLLVSCVFQENGRLDSRRAS